MLNTKPRLKCSLIQGSLILAFSQYKRWILNPRMLLLLYTIIFINDTVTAKMLDLANELGYTLNIVELLRL